MVLNLNSPSVRPVKIQANSQYLISKATHYLFAPGYNIKNCLDYYTPTYWIRILNGTPFE